MVDSMHQSWLSQVVKAVYRSGSETETMSIFRRTEPLSVTAARSVQTSLQWVGVVCQGGFHQLKLQFKNFESKWSKNLNRMNE